VYRQETRKKRLLFMFNLNDGERWRKHLWRRERNWDRTFSAYSRAQTAQADEAPKNGAIATDGGLLDLFVSGRQIRGAAPPDETRGRSLHPPPRRVPGATYRPR
jgi:hypothetical protein